MKPITAIRVSARRINYRSGVTLVELLVVVGIILLVSAVGLTVFTPSLPSRQLREASRELTALLQGARDRAMRIKRRVGVQIDRLRNAGDLNNPTAAVGLNPRVGFRASLVEEPPPYAGDYIDSQMTITFNTSSSTIDGYLLGTIRFMGSASTTTNTDIGWMGQFRKGALVEFGAQGHQFVLLDPPDSSYIDSETKTYIKGPGLGPDNMAGTGDDTYWPVVCLTYRSFPQVTISAPYKIIRDPVVASAGAVEFPPQVAIDMGASGLTTGTGGDEFTGLQSGTSPRYFTDLPVQIFFGPDGGVFRVRYGGWSDDVGEEGDTPLITERSSADNSTIVAPPTGPICLMLGKIEQVSLDDLNEPQIHTWQDPDSLWVTIDPVTGRIKSTENNYLVGGTAAVPAPVSDGVVANAADKRTQLSRARKYALDAQSLGGR